RKATNFVVNLWAELCNPFLAGDATLLDQEQGNARLYVVPGAGLPGYPAYRLQVARPLGAATPVNRLILAQENTGGLPDYVQAADVTKDPPVPGVTAADTTNAQVQTVGAEWTPTGPAVDRSVILPLNNAYA